MHSAKQMSHFEQVHENSCLFFQSVRVLFISTTNPKQLAPVFLAPVWCPLIALTKTFFAYSVLYFVLINLSSTSRYLCICCCTRILFVITYASCSPSPPPRFILTLSTIRSGGKEKEVLIWQ